MGWTVVLDVGKTLVKATLWDERGCPIESRTRPGALVQTGDYWTLDTAGIENWLAGALREFARLGPVDAIVPVAHGAAAALVRNGHLACAPMDYEWPGSTDRAAYLSQRDAFALTGSPALPGGLNLGVQLHDLEKLRPGCLRGSEILPWPQYWGWVLSGVAAAEVTSLGCHTDLWFPFERGASRLAVARGWAERFAPLMPAGASLGVLTPAWVQRTGLSSAARVLCGLHDSKPALLGARSHPQLAGRDATVLSTGTWFVAMRAPGAAAPLSALPEGRDCLINVDVAGVTVPSARFMGGRELEVLLGRQSERRYESDALVEAARRVVEARSMILPTAVAGVGPFPARPHRLVGDVADDAEGVARAHLYAALVADESLDLIGSRDCVLVEGRFAQAPLFVRALASLRPTSQVLVNSGGSGVALGALTLLHRQPAPESLSAEQPLPIDVAGYRAHWRELLARSPA